jgi:hypothetical protein
MTDDARFQTDHDLTEDPRGARPGVGCEACRAVGPLLTAPGTSGRDWRCQCGQVWTGALQRQTAEVARAAGLAPAPDAVDQWRPECGRQVRREDRLPWLVGFLSRQVEVIVEAYAAGDDAELRRQLTAALAVVEASR